MPIDLIGRFFLFLEMIHIGHFLVKKTLTLKTRLMQKLSCDSFELSLALKQRLEQLGIGLLVEFCF